ncbi:MurR/RpiR family transcriptional regulator [Streptomyces sp. TS71-3]|uniref:MurR/RpiR family transcriptional regulator n=1 Tax=Streptomyces sp. TS71-3 TaxID=2733862 RepID=UPI001B28BFE0|nr:MurR/RpiR family transcriptional regulator [Streptomyces sp. TS71-3]GHJ39328.1 RpiR family transcriptional regulator [Streptomyces sp. TS71-3]
MNASEEGGHSLASRVNHEWSRLTRTERKVARYLVAAAPQDVMLAAAGDIAQRTGTSDATVVRTARRLGYAGLPDLKSSLGAHFGAGGAPQISIRLEVSEASEDLAATSSAVVDDAVERIRQFGRTLDVARLTEALQLIVSAEEVFCYGWGSNELSARYLALKLNRAGKRSRHCGTTGFTLADDLLTLTSRHAAVLFAPGRALPDLRLLVDHAKATGVGTILVTERLDQEIAADVDVVLGDGGSPGGLTAEPLCAMLLADMLVLAMMSVGKDRAVDTYALLTRLRKEIVPDV